MRNKYSLRIEIDIDRNDSLVELSTSVNKYYNMLLNMSIINKLPLGKIPPGDNIPNSVLKNTVRQFRSNYWGHAERSPRILGLLYPMHWDKEDVVYSICNNAIMLDGGIAIPCRLRGWDVRGVTIQYDVYVGKVVADVELKKVW